MAPFELRVTAHLLLQVSYSLSQAPEKNFNKINLYKRFKN